MLSTRWRGDCCISGPASGALVSRRPTLKKGLGSLNTKNLTAAGMLAAPIKSRHVKFVMSYNPLTIFLSREGILIEIENCIEARRERAFFCNYQDYTRFHTDNPRQ